MSISLHTGNPRTGKTYGMNIVIIKCLNQGIHVWANYKINWYGYEQKKWNWKKLRFEKIYHPASNLHYWKTLEDLYDVEKGVIAMDEAHVYINSRRWANMPEDFERKIAQHGKDGLKEVVPLRFFRAKKKTLEWLRRKRKMPDNNLRYKNLFNILLANKQRKMQGNVEQIPQSLSDEGVAYSTSPETMMQYLNAYSPFDMARKPSSVPQRLDYSTSGFNVNDPELGKNAILLASERPKSIMLPIYSQQDNESMYADIPEDERYKRSTAILEHEIAHGKELKIGNTYGNKGYLRRNGMPGEIATREDPAMNAEDRYWDKQASEYRKKKKGK